MATITYEPVLERMRQVPGVQSPAITALPLSGMNIGSSFEIVAQPSSPGNHPEARVSAVSADYARTLEGRLRRAA